MDKNKIFGNNNKNYDRNSYNEDRDSKNEVEKQAEKKVYDDVVVGRNAVIEALKSNSKIEHILIKSGEKQGSIIQIIALAKKAGITIKEVSVQKLNFMSGNNAHQGVIAILSAASYVDVEDIIKFAKTQNQDPFVIIADEIQDPHNLGAIIRTAEACGVHGIIIPKRGTAPISSTVYKTSAGAVSHMKIAKVSNLVSTIEKLKKYGIWVYTAEADGQSFDKLDYSGGVCLIIGSEGNGVGQLIQKHSDFKVAIPMKGKLNSLNASVAASILMYQISRSK